MSITILLSVGLSALAGAVSAEDRLDRPAPNVQRQIDQLERRGTVDPATRRRLQDQLRGQPEGAERSAAERRLERLEGPAPAADEPLPEAPRSDSLPSSLRPGFGDESGGGSGGGPGTSGHMVPPGGRSGGVR